MVGPRWIRRLFSQESKNSIFDLNRATGGRANPQIDLQAVPTLTYNNFINTNQLPVSFTPGLTWGADYNLPTTYTMQYLLNVQRTLGNNSTLEATFLIGLYLSSWRISPSAKSNDFSIAVESSIRWWGDGSSARSPRCKAGHRS